MRDCGAGRDCLVDSVESEEHRDSYQVQLARPADKQSRAAGLSETMMAVVRLARPEQWIKNGIVLVPVLFGGHGADPGAWLRAAAVSVAFCLVSSAVYALNDVVDRESDRLHPHKKKRPVAAGAIRIRTAVMAAAVLCTVGMAAVLVVSPMVLVAVGSYVLLQLLYCVYLKQKVILDVMCIALGFVLRAISGALAIRVEPSPWLVTCTFTVCLFMGFSKRRSEIGTLDSAVAARRHRATLDSYTPELLMHLMTLSGAVAVVSYLLYASSHSTTERFGPWMLIFNAPFVIYAVFRFAMVSILGMYPGPTELILHDRHFQVSIIFWFASVCLIVLLRAMNVM